MKNSLLFSILAMIFIAGCTSSGNAPSSSSLMHVCTAEEKAAEACTLEYMPVCGSDGVTYGNDCGACAAGVDSWIIGECQKDSDLAASSAPAADIPMWTCEFSHKVNKVCTGPVEEVCGNDNMTYDNGCRACSFGADYYIGGNCSTPNEWTMGFANLQASTNESRQNFDFSDNMIIESFQIVGDFYIDQFGALNGLSSGSQQVEFIIEEDLTYANMQVMPNKTSYIGIAGPKAMDKYWVKTAEGRTVKMEILSVDENGGIFFNWAIKQ